MSQSPLTREEEKRTPGDETVPPLEAGDNLDQPTFHERYLAMPEGTRAELIGGVVYVHSPAKRPHSRTSGRVVRWLGAYEDATPGTELHDNGSNLLGPESEPQPDACLLIASACGGQTSDRDDWIVGAPELVAEVASSTESIDLHGKKADYEKCGVKEYIVVALRQQRVFWFINRDDSFVELAPGADGIYRSEVFPGLWLDPAALLAGNMLRVRQVLDAGLASPEHAAFVARLGASS
jgi:Uma2 family endonuclease